MRLTPPRCARCALSRLAAHLHHPLGVHEVVAEAEHVELNVEIAQVGDHAECPDVDSGDVVVRDADVRVVRRGCEDRLDRRGGRWLDESESVAEGLLVVVPGAGGLPGATPPSSAPHQ